MLHKKNVGYIGVGIDEKYNIEKNVKSGIILDIGVLKPYRRKDIGTRLMLHSLETLKGKGGITQATLGVDDFNPTKAIKLYEVGFEVAKKDFTYKKTLCFCI